MKNKDMETSLEISRLPDFRIEGRCRNIIDCIRRVKTSHWLFGISILLAIALLLMPDHIWKQFWTRIKANGNLVILILIFCIVALSLVWKKGENIDIWTFMVFNMRGYRAPWVDWAMLSFTQLGSGVFGIGAGIVYFLADHDIFAYEIILGTLTLWLAVELMKALIRRPRPHYLRIVGAKAGGNSFPSGHTSQSFFLATLFLHSYKADFLWILVVYSIAGLVGITRMYVGMHYPRDVLGGAVFGTVWGIFWAIINNYFFR